MKFPLPSGSRTSTAPVVAAPPPVTTVPAPLLAPPSSRAEAAAVDTAITSEVEPEALHHPSGALRFELQLPADSMQVGSPLGKLTLSSPMAVHATSDPHDGLQVEGELAIGLGRRAWPRVGVVFQQAALKPDRRQIDLQLRGPRPWRRGERRLFAGNALAFAALGGLVAGGLRLARRKVYAATLGAAAATPWLATQPWPAGSPRVAGVLVTGTRASLPLPLSADVGAALRRFDGDAATAIACVPYEVDRLGRRFGIASAELQATLSADDCGAFSLMGWPGERLEFDLDARARHLRSRVSLRAKSSPDAQPRWLRVGLETDAPGRPPEADAPKTRPRAGTQALPVSAGGIPVCSQVSEDCPLSRASGAPPTSSMQARAEAALDAVLRLGAVQVRGRVEMTRHPRPLHLAPHYGDFLSLACDAWGRQFDIRSQPDPQAQNGSPGLMKIVPLSGPVHVSMPAHKNFRLSAAVARAGRALLGSFSQSVEDLSPTAPPQPYRRLWQALTPHLGPRVALSSVTLAPARLLTDNRAPWMRAELAPNGWIVPEGVRTLLVRSGLLPAEPLSVELVGLRVAAHDDRAWLETELVHGYATAVRRQLVSVDVTAWVPAVERLQTPLLARMHSGLAEGPNLPRLSGAIHSDGACVSFALGG